MKISKYIIPILVVVFLSGGYLLRPAFTKPTTDVAFTKTGGEELTCIVDGLKCKGTANFFTRLFVNTPGIISIVTFATEHKAVIKYNPGVITPEGIQLVIEQAIPLNDGTSRQVFTLLSMD